MRARLVPWPLLVLAACTRAPPPVDAGLPPGALLSGKREAVDSVARCLTAFAESPAAIMATKLQAKVATCTTVSASAETVAGLADSVACAGPADPLATLRGTADVAFALPFGDGRWVGTAMVGTDGAITMDARANLDGLTGLAKLATPDATPPGPARLSDVDALGHIRFHSNGGIDLAALVPEKSQADEMFKLKSSLFAGTVLDGTWEAALYQPPMGRAVPRMALAIGTRSQDAAKAAMEQYVSQVTAQWKLQATPFVLDGPSGPGTPSAPGTSGPQGSCLADLHLLPGLAPCYVSTANTIVLGWDPDSVRHALRRDPAEVDPLSGGSGWSIHLDRLPEADQLVASALGGGIPPVGTKYPWGTVTAVASRGEDGVTQVQLRSTTGCASAPPR